MPEYMVTFTHVDRADDPEVIWKFVWEASDTEVARHDAKRLLPAVKEKAEMYHERTFDIADLEAHVAPLEHQLCTLRIAGMAAREIINFLNKYSFVKEGAMVWWNDPDGGTCSGNKKVTHVSQNFSKDSTVMLDGGTEAYLSELEPPR